MHICIYTDTSIIEVPPVVLFKIMVVRNPTGQHVVHMPLVVIHLLVIHIPYI